MKISNTDFKDLFVVTLNSFEDVRGSFKEVYSSKTINEYLGYKLGDFPNAEEASKKVLSLPMHGWISDEDIHTVINTLKTI